MTQRLFTVGKIPVFVDAMASGLERRAGGHDAKVLRLTCRIEPFDATHAADLDAGLGGDSNVRASCFTLTDGTPKPHIERVSFTLDCPRQRLDLYASSDTARSRLCFDHVKVSGFYVRTAKDTGALAAVFTATFGPVGRDELEAAHAAVRTQTFVTFHEAEPSLAFDESDDAPRVVDSADATWPNATGPKPGDLVITYTDDGTSLDNEPHFDVIPPPALDDEGGAQPEWVDVDESDVFDDAGTKPVYDDAGAQPEPSNVLPMETRRRSTRKRTATRQSAKQNTAGRATSRRKGSRV